MKYIVLTEAELNALQGEPAEVFKFYVCLRWRMDRQTGLVGASVGVSWQGLREDMYVEPTPGRQNAGLPTEKFVRKKAECLAARGLLENQTSYQRLVFSLPLAHTQQVRQKNKGQVWGRVMGQAMGQTEAQEPQWLDDAMGQAMGQTENALMGHTSDVRVNQLFVVNRKPPPCTEAVDNSVSDPLMVVAVVLANWIQKAERGRGCISRIKPDSAAVMAWARDGITLEQLVKAYSEASWDREKHNNPSPINAPFLDTILRRQLNHRRVSRKSESDAPRVWHSTPEGIAAKAQQIGMERRPDETDEQLRGRVSFALAGHSTDRGNP